MTNSWDKIVKNITRFAECFNNKGLSGFTEGEHYRFEKDGEWFLLKKVDGKWIRTGQSFTVFTFIRHFS